MNNNPGFKDKVLESILEGKTNLQICKIINRQLPTVTYYVGKLFKEYNVKNREELIVKVKSGGKMLEEWNYTESESGRSETLIKAIEKIEILEKKLNLALSCIKDYANEDNWCGHGGSSADIWCGPRGTDGFLYARKALKEITDVE